jgi:hypothetical protein
MDNDIHKMIRCMSTKKSVKNPMGVSGLAR